jgi:hypothetical protein
MIQFSSVFVNTKKIMLHIRIVYEPSSFACFSLLMVFMRIHSLLTPVEILRVTTASLYLLNTVTITGY